MNNYNAFYNFFEYHTAILTIEDHMTLTKNDIIERVNNSGYGFTKKKTTEVVENLLELIKKTLENEEAVMVSNFGKFQVAEKGERKGRNPATNDDLILSARRVVTFKPSSTLREKVNGNKKR
jgi:integration host factor subunit alpha